MPGPSKHPRLGHSGGKPAMGRESQTMLLGKTLLCLTF
jgi:hypothetical protein